MTNPLESLTLTEPTSALAENKQSGVSKELSDNGQQAPSADDELSNTGESSLSNNESIHSKPMTIETLESSSEVTEVPTTVEHKSILGPEKVTRRSKSDGTGLNKVFHLTFS